MRGRARCRWLVLAMAGAAGIGCGARSTLTLPEPCDEPGGRRACSDLCGAGTEVCNHGYWQPCAVPISTRACTNVCGAGSQTCSDGAWGTCSVPTTTRGCTSACGAGIESCADDLWGPCDAPAPGLPTLLSTVRNVRVGTPDFLASCCSGGVDPGIVGVALGADGTPVYAGNPVTGTLTTAGASSFRPWYHDVPGVNERTTLPLPFVPQPGEVGTNEFVNDAFFPIDGVLFGDQGAAHNYDFTLQAHAMILYTGGETYGFSSDDDLWVFVNGRLVIDLGGLHASMSQSVALDDVASPIGITVGHRYPFDLFYANREPPGAVLAITLPQSDLWSCPP